MSSSNNKIERIPVSDIRPNPYQPRKKFQDEALDELGKSIKHYGILQPLNVRKITDTSYELVAGERRLRAAKSVGLEYVPAIVVDYREEDSAVLAMVENLQREDLNYIEEANGYNNLIIDHGLTQKEIAEKVGKSQSTIANKLRILKLPVDIQRKLVENGLSERHGRALLKLPTYELRLEILSQVISNGLNVRHTEELVESVLDEILNGDNGNTGKEDKKPETKPNMKSFISTKIYINTLKQAYKAIKDTGVNADYSEVENDDFVEVTVRIPKKVAD